MAIAFEVHTGGIPLGERGMMRRITLVTLLC